jgi:hypothetical protein
LCSHQPLISACGSVSMLDQYVDISNILDANIEMRKRIKEMIYL